MKKIVTSVFLIVVIMIFGYFIFIQNFELFPGNRIELVEFKIDGLNYKLYSFEGDATVSSNIQLFKNEMMLEVFKTTVFYSQGEIINQNDSTLTLLLSNEKLSFKDTIRVRFTMPTNFKILNRP